MSYTKPIRPPFIVAADKVEKFLAQKPDPAVIEKRKRIVAMFKENNRRNKDKWTKNFKYIIVYLTILVYNDL